MDNSLHYVPPGGQVVIGVRWMEHKGKPLLLFFVMDNGPVVPEALRHADLRAGLRLESAGAQRTGRSLFKVREFAVAHAGSVWVESKTGRPARSSCASAPTARGPPPPPPPSAPDEASSKSASSQSPTPARWWVESKTGKACTFFLRVRPDGAQVSHRRWLVG